MTISFNEMLQKYAACVAALDEEKHCGTCRYKEQAHDDKPCDDCYIELLGMPVNPTKWVAPNTKNTHESAPSPS